MTSPRAHLTSSGRPSRLAGTPLNRRALIRTVTAAGALVAWPALLGCASPSRPCPTLTSPVSPTWTQPTTPLVMIIRYAEKPPKSSRSGGIDLQGRADSHSLTARGWTRAAYLPDLFIPSSTSPQTSWGDGSGASARLPMPRTIYASGPGNGDGEGTRCRETVGPLAAALGLRVNSSFSRGQEAELARQAATAPGPVLICWQHGQIPALAAAFTPAAPAPPSVWPDERFDMVWVFAATDSGSWRFEQVPQRLMPDDVHPGFSSSRPD